MGSLGEKLIDLCRGADCELVIAAPFIKAAALSRVLANVKPSVAVVCCTRWIPEEIASGITDIEVWDILKARGTSKLFLRSNLHAKYYRADESCLVGSANVTAAALGWRPDSNLEILTTVEQAAFVEFESAMLGSAVLVDESLYASVRELVARIKTSVARDEFVIPPDEDWVPRLRNPEELFDFYTGDGDKLSSASRVTAADDLSHFAVSAGFDRSGFERYIGLEFLQKPVIAAVDALLVKPQRFGAVTELIRERVPQCDADGAWQTIMRWMRHFLPQRYALAIPNHSEVLFRLDETVRTDSGLGKVHQLLESLSTDKSHGGWTAESDFQAPHKPLLLLSVLKLFDEGKISGRRIEPSMELETIFNRLASEVYPDLQLGEMSLPFFHLESDGLWRLVPRKPGAAIPDKARKNVANLRTFVRFAELREDCYLAFLSTHARRDALEIILKRYFSEQSAKRLREALPATPAKRKTAVQP